MHISMCRARTTDRSAAGSSEELQFVGLANCSLLAEDLLPVEVIPCTCALSRSQMAFQKTVCLPAEA